MPGPAATQAKLPAKHNPYTNPSGVRAVFTIGALATRSKTVSVQLNDANGKACAERIGVMGYLSDDANGDAIVSAAPSTATAGGTDGMFVALTTKTFLVVSEADGDIDIVITEASADTLYLVLIMPDGTLCVSGAITFPAP